MEHVANGLDAREGKAGTVSFVGRGGEHPRAARMAEGHGVSGVSDAVDVETGLLGSEGFSGGNECGVDDLFSCQAARGGGCEERARLFEGEVIAALVGVGGENEFGQVARIVAGFDEFASEPPQ